MNLPPDHPPVPKPRIGVLLMNLGTPDAPDAKSVKRYLGQFLSDKRVIEIPQLLWQPILRGVILNVRPKKSAHAYAQVWREDGSPLQAITTAQSLALKDRFGSGVLVEHAMRYGNPSIPDKLAAMKAAGCERILLAPLYPQYCAATTATANDQAFAVLAKMRWQPALRTMPPYHDDPDYIAALHASIDASLAQLDFEPQRIIASFHGMPKRTLALGDPYHCHCQKTARLLSESMGRPITIAFQSRFGPAKWLEPATDLTLASLPAQGVKSVAVVAPGFSADCLETLEEMAIRGRETFEEAGGERFAYLPCLNDSDLGVALLEKLVARELEGWRRPA
ncbi:ferrochelatase [Sphingomonas arantia]|uniref:Ferrochelatase n=1 Tax=Sphingomonas arantia TaxID=1460676 RepID=A0ABW4U2Z8_9SPHN